MRRLAEAAEVTGAGAVVLIVSRRLNELAHEYTQTAAQGPIPAEVGGGRQPTPRQRLSEREEQVLRQISRGLTHRQAAIQGSGRPPQPRGLSVAEMFASDRCRDFHQTLRPVRFPACFSCSRYRGFNEEARRTSG